MFWRFGAYASISAIDAILEKPDFTLEDLLDEADLIQELKQHNAKLVEYLREPKVLETLLEYVVMPKLEPVAAPADEEAGEDGDQQATSKGKGLSLPFSRPRASSRATDSGRDEEDAEKKRNRYAFVAAEILSSDNWSIYEAVMESRELLRKFWQFVKNPAPLDPLQAGYFTKVNESLFEQKTDEMIELLRSIDGAVADLLAHVDSPMIMDLLLRIISLERTESGQGVVEWLYTQDVMPILISFLGPQHSWATQTSAGDFMKAIITISANASQNEQTCIGPNELTRQLVSRPCVEQLIKYMLGGGNPLTVGVGIIIEVIRKNNSDYDPDVGAEPNSPPSSRDPIYLGTLLRLFAEHVPDFMELIMHAPARREHIDSTFADQIEPLGFDRFKTCELMAELLHCSNMALLNEAGSEELIAARDAERQRLRADGRLLAFRGGVDDGPSSAEDLTLRISQSSAAGAPNAGPPSADGSRRLEVMNVATDDDGFEEVTHAGDEDADTSHEFVRAEDDIPDLPQIPSFPPTSSSFLDRDDDEDDEDDFVDEPLSSPRLHVREVDEKNEVSATTTPSTSTTTLTFDNPDLMVAPLSPSKAKAAEIKSETEKPESDGVGASSADKMAELSLQVGTNPAGAKTSSDPQDTSQSETAPSPPVLTPGTESEPVDSKPDQAESPPAGEESQVPPAQVLAPRAEDTPAPLFSGRDSSEEERAAAEGGGPATTQADQGEEHDGPADTGPVVGDYLKVQFVEHRVVPTILSFFFRYPWNNFLHNVVYDVVQQVFNGPMDRGYNPVLAVSLFEAADVTAQIIAGQAASEKSQALHKTRMGYMGHLTLIAEEVVKFTERHPPELLSDVVLDRVMAPDWINYVEGALAETRERDNAILGGVRPEVAMSNRAGAGGGPGGGPGGGGASGLAAVGLSSIGLSGAGGIGGSGGPQAASSALADAGLNGSLDGDDGNANGLGPFTISGGTLMSGFGSSSDEDDDDEQESEEDVNNEFRAYTDPLNSNNQSSPLMPPAIPPPPPPPPPLNIPPSRARRQLAARLAMNKRNAEAASAAEGGGSGGGDGANGSGPSDPTSSSSPPRHPSGGLSPSSGLKSLQAAAELSSGIDPRPWDPRDPFMDDDEDDGGAGAFGRRGSGSDDSPGRDGDDDEEGDVGSGGSGGWNKGGWWRGVVRSARRSKKGRNSSSGNGGGAGGKGFGDSEDDDSAGVGEGGGDDADDNDSGSDEEFGDFAMPEVGSPPRRTGATVPPGSAGSSPTTTTSSTSSGIDPSREKVLLKPLPVHPTAALATGGKSGGFGSLWPFSSPPFGGSKDKNRDKDDDNDSEISQEPLDLEGPPEVLGEDGKKIDRAVEAKRRTSIEDPDDDDDVVSGTAAK